jgi:hypothetical protein
VVLVHGIVRDRDAGVVDRVEGARTVTAGELAALVSDAPQRELTGEDAVTHLDLLVAAVAEVPVLPLALGTAVPDDATVAEAVLLPDADALARRLQAVADLVELRLDLSFDTDVAVAAIAAEDPAVRRLAEVAGGPRAGLAERLALGEATAVRVAEREAALTEQWTADLADVAERSVLVHADEQVRRTAYLVRRDRVDDADAAVARLRVRAEGMAGVEYVGPLPVFSFLDDLDEDAVARTGSTPSRWGW